MDELKKLKQQFFNELDKSYEEDYEFKTAFYYGKLKKLPFKTILKIYRQRFNNSYLRSVKKVLSNKIITSLYVEYLKNNNKEYLLEKEV